LTSDFWAVFEEKGYKGNQQKDKEQGQKATTAVSWMAGAPPFTKRCEEWGTGKKE
jgi:hypothetical protein